MVRSLRSYLRLIPVLLLLFAMGLPLCAQLDPRLQVSKTDFMDLFQQSSTAKVKPEILTIFDFSGSMKTLMFHPQYINNDPTDADDYRYMKFVLTPGSDTPQNNTYVITAKSKADSKVLASITFTVASDGSVSTSNSTATYPYSGTDPSGHNPSSAGIYYASSYITVSGTGSTRTLSVTMYIYNKTTSSQSVDGGINPWSSSPALPLNPTTTTYPNTLAKSKLFSQLNTTTWTVPAYNADTIVDPYVTVTLDPTVPGSGAVADITYLTSTLSSTQLVKPNGTILTKDDVGTPSGSLHGMGAGIDDVRNWVRAASHVRFATTVGTDTRTLDIPIPWKITNGSSSGSPLSSQTVHDKVTEASTDGKTTTVYGSDTDIEMDRNYLVDSGDKIFATGLNRNGDPTGTVGAGTVTTVYLSQIGYRPAYISWLFNGKYSTSSSTAPYSPSYSGKYIVFDAATGNLAGGQGTSNVAWGKGYGTFLSGDTVKVPDYSLTGVYLGTESSVSPSDRIIPALNRSQAVKRAAIQTWITYQAKVNWAFRFLDVTTEAKSSNIDNDSNSTTNSADDPTTTAVNGSDSSWRLLNNTDSITSKTGNSVTGMKRIASLFANNGTPLTYAMARGLAQFTDPKSVFNDAYSTDNPPSQCMSHFLILFTDGIDNNGGSNVNGNTDTPYLVADSKDATITNISADNGNKTILNNTALIDNTGSYWNLFTFAGIGAHMADASLGTIANKDYKAALDPGTSPSAADSPHAFLPLAIKQRNGTTFDHDHRITTMTVGVSLGGTYADAGSPKRALFLAAAVGDPLVSAYTDISTLTPFVWNEVTQKKATGTIYFFDATNPKKLSDDLANAIKAAAGGGILNVASGPNLPFIGASLGKQIYLGQFLPPPNGGVLWSGDLLMFPTSIDSNSKTVILDKSGVTATSLDSSTAVWSASKALLNNRRWDARKLYTRIPGSSTTPEPGLSTFTYKDAAYTNGTTDTPPGLMNYVATGSTTTFPPGGAAQQNLVKFAMGANPSDPLNSTNSKANRSTIMGDVIDSQPAYLEYKWSEVKDRFPSGSALSTSRNRFRIILVGDNQGWLHAFGETTTITSKVLDPKFPDVKVDLVAGEVDELWSFMPTDFLANLDYLNTPSNSHKFMVDGSPTIYFLDLPSSSGGSGNGVLDGSNVAISDYTADTTHERAIAIIGLRKGGRSYYAINLHDPFSPKLQWSLVPDEAANIPTTRNLTGLSDATLQGIIANMGFSTCNPSIGRVLYGGVYTDVVFFGGGLSLPEVEAKFTGTPKLGRSVIAVEVNTGNILAAVDLTSTSISSTTIGPISAGVVPFEFFLGSGMAQRAYFLDMWGGLWCWGSKQVVASTDKDYISSYNKFRKDTSDLKNWTSDGTVKTAIANSGVRKVYQDPASTVSTTDGTLSGPAYTTLPSPFLVGTFPGHGHTDSTSTTAIPSAVGIAMVSGDRNDPLDFGTNTPANTRLTVVFDRQDSRAWGLDTEAGPDAGINTDDKLLNAGKWGAAGAISSTKAYGDATITVGDSYYLAPSDPTLTKFGYYVTFPDKQVDSKVSTLYHYSKGINPPLVVAGSLYYAYFTPSAADVCIGGSGFTYSNLICDVMNPVVNDVRTGLLCTSGKKDKWVNVASDFSMLGAPGVQQAGTRSKVDPNDNTKTINYLDTSTYLGQGQQRYPKARVWRTVH